MGSSGQVYGPWQAVGSPGQGGVPNAYWVARLRITLPPDTYTVLDSDPSTWARNRGTGGAGFASVEGWYHWTPPPNGYHRGPAPDGDGSPPWNWLTPAPQ
jgi:hypothetical protein